MSRKTEWLLKPRYRMGPPPRSLAIDAQDCIMGRVKKTAGYKFAARTYARQEAGSTRIIFRTASPWVSLPPCSRPSRTSLRWPLLAVLDLGSPRQHLGNCSIPAFKKFLLCPLFVSEAPVKPSTRKKRPIPAVMDQVRITRDGNDAIIEYADPMISDTRLTIGSQIKGMTDKDIIDVFNGVMAAQETQNLYKYALDLTVGLRRGGCPTKLVVRRHAAGSIFSLANGKASRKVCIGVLPKHQRP